MGGGPKQYQITVDPTQLRAYNLTLKQVFDAVSSNNSNAGGSYLPAGEYALIVRGLGLIQSMQDIENIVVAAQKGTPVRVRDIATVGVGPGLRLGKLGRDHEDDLVQGIVLMRRGENPGKVIEGVKAKVLSQGIGAEIQRPLARVVIGGLVSSTVLTLLVLPAVYALFARRHRVERGAPASAAEG